MNPPPVAVSTGDPGGVGPEVALRAAAEFDQQTLLFGDAAGLEALAEVHGVGVARGTPASPGDSRIVLVDCGISWDAEATAHRPTASGGVAQLAALDAALAAVMSGQARALATAPMSKEAVVRGGHPFSGHTEHLARAAQLADDEVTMMFLGPRLRVALVTTHAAVAQLPSLVTAARVARACTHLGEALTALGAARVGAEVVVTGLNPHAGEGGMFGAEEATAIAPGVELAGGRPPYVGNAGLRLSGPVGAETAMRQAAQGEVAGVVAMTHDQATIASKLLDWGSAVNVTWGLPFVRTSVDHGVAYDAARAGGADAAGMLAALRMAQRLCVR